MSPEGVHLDGVQQSPASMPAVTPDAPVRSHEDVLRLIEDVEVQLERLRTAQVRSAEEFAHYADRGRRLDEREREIAVASALLTAREAQLQVMADATRAEEARLGERHRTIDAEMEALSAARVEADERERVIATRAEKVSEAERTLEAARRSLDERAAEVASTDSARAAEFEALATERSRIAEAERAIEAERLAMAEARRIADERLHALEGEIVTLNERVTALQVERDRVGRESDEGRAALERAESNAAMLMLAVATLRERLEDCETSLASRDAAIDAKESTIAERDAQLAERDASIAERDARIDELSREIAMTRQSLRTAGEKLANLAKAVADQAPQLERGAAAAALAHEQRERIASLEERIESLERELAERREAIVRAEREVAELRSAATAAPQVVVDTTQVDRMANELDAARHDIERLEREIAAARETEESRRNESESARIADAERAVAETQARLGEALGFLATRKRRIDLARRLQRERKAKREREVRQAAENAMVRVLEEERLVKKQREELRQVQEVLTATETMMVQRYARHRGGLVAAWCTLVVAGLAAGSWFAADAVLPGGSVASVDLLAKVDDPQGVTPEADTLFQSTHREALNDEGFRETVRRRLADRGVQSLKGDEVDAWLDGVTYDSDGPGSLRLIAEGPDPQTATIALDTLATTLVNESAKLAKGKGEVARATIAGNSQVPGRITFSTLTPNRGPLDRIMAAGMVFSAVFTLSLVAGLVTFSRIARAKRRFEDAERFGATL